MRSGTGWITALLLAAALCLLAAGRVAAGDSDSVAVEDQSDSPAVVVVAQEGGSDQESDSGLRLIDRQSTTRVDAVVIALWSIAGGMTVMLAIFLWHTSPRRRLRLARTREALLVEQSAEPDESELTDESEPSGEPDEAETADEESGQGFWPRPDDRPGLD